MAICARCNGRGTIACPKCEGHGRLEEDQLVLIATRSAPPWNCPECKGTGFLACPDCEGSGEIDDEDD